MFIKILENFSLNKIPNTLFQNEEVDNNSTVIESIYKKHHNRKNHNQYFTPEIVVEKALAFVPMLNVTNIIDPAVGYGIFLKVASNKWNNAKLFGIDVDRSVIQNLKRMKILN